MKRQIISIFTVIVMLLCMAVTAGAAATDSAVIDSTRVGSLTVYKYDIASAEAAGVWSADGYSSTGVYDADGVNAVLGEYALQGVEFSYLKDDNYFLESNGAASSLITSPFDGGLLVIRGLNSFNSHVSSTSFGKKPSSSNM